MTRLWDWLFDERPTPRDMRLEELFHVYRLLLIAYQREPSTREIWKWDDWFQDEKDSLT